MIRLIFRQMVQDGIDSERPEYKTLDVEVPEIEALLDKQWHLFGYESYGMIAPSIAKQEDPWCGCNGCRDAQAKEIG